MSTQNQKNLKISWSTSRTTGFNICRLKDESTGKSYRVDGGGFNMIAYVFAEWAGDVFQEAIQQEQARGQSFPSFIDDQGRVDASSVAGMDEITRALQLVGFNTEFKRNAKGNIIGLTVSSEPEHQEKIDTGPSM